MGRDPRGELIRGDPAAAGEPLVRVHSACAAGERFGALICDCALRLRDALQEIAVAEAGVLIYLRGAEGELVTGLDRCPRRAPDASLAAAILRSLGVGRTVRSGPVPDLRCANGPEVRHHQHRRREGGLE